MTPDQKIAQYWYNGTWHAGGLSNATGATAAALGMAISSQYNGIARTSEVYYVGADNHVYQFWYNGTWHIGDLSAATGAPNANP
ncbi:MAG TPA: hypothetical protein VFT22_02975 [Kofleriaceae bacterium]|nr:hypothetical protein [Kofleriaceae bacterium]